MQFCYFHLMPYTDSNDAGTDWPVANWRFNAERGTKLYQIYIDNMAYAEECGFDWIGCNEHHMSPYGLMSNPNLIAAALIAKTKTAKLAIVGNLVPLLNPLRVAEEYAMLDVMSGGRLVAGMMRGIPHEYVAYNVSGDESYGRLLEALAFIKKAWTEAEPFGWEGEYYQYRAVSIWPKPRQQPHPPILMSGSSKGSAKIAGLQRAILGLVNVLNYDEARGLIAAYREGAAEAGWTPKRQDILVGFPCSIDEKAEVAIANLNMGRHFLATVLGGGIRTAQRIVLQKTRYYDDETKNKFVDMRQSYAPKVEDLLKDGTVLCGTPEMVVSQIKRVREELGPGVLNLSMKIGNVPDAAVNNSMRLFKERVLPHVRDL